MVRRSIRSLCTLIFVTIATTAFGATPQDQKSPDSLICMSEKAAHDLASQFIDDIDGPRFPQMLVSAVHQHVCVVRHLSPEVTKSLERGEQILSLTTPLNMAESRSARVTKLSNDLAVELELLSKGVTTSPLWIVSLIDTSDDMGT